MKNPKPPKILEFILKKLFPDHGQYTTLGDLEEVFLQMVDDYGVFQAKFWYFSQFNKAIFYIINDFIHGSIQMFKNYLKVAIRNLKKHKTFTILNALGLSVGLAASLFLLLASQYEIQYDQYHVNKDNIYRMSDVINASATQSNENATVPLPWGPEMKRVFPEIKMVARLYRVNHAVKNGDNFINESFNYTDPELFEMFTYKLIKGDPKTVLTQPNSVVISQRIADKYFKDEDPVGKELQLPNKAMTVTGLMENMPDASSYAFNIAASMSSWNVETLPDLENWRSHYIMTYFLMEENFNQNDLERKMGDFINTKVDQQFQDRYKPFLTNLGDLHFTPDMNSDWNNTLDYSYIIIFNFITILILLIACINFMNLSTAKSSARSKEVGVRKVLGAFKIQLIKQFLAETFVVAFIAMIIALFLVESTMPWWSSLTQRDISIDYFSNSTYVMGIIGYTLLMGLLAGSYPAFFMSSLKPVNILKGSKNNGSSNSRMRKFLVISQFSVAVFMIMVNLVLMNQIDYLLNKDLGFDKEAVVAMPGFSDLSTEKANTIKAELLQNPVIRDVTFASVEPGDGAGIEQYRYEGLDDPKGERVSQLSVDYGYFDMLGLEIVEGRYFSEDFGTDSEEAIVINETAVRQFGWENPIGKRMDELGLEEGVFTTRRVVGVVKDFHFQSLHSPIRPLVINLRTSPYHGYYIKIDDSRRTEAVDFIKTKWSTYRPNVQNFHYILSEDLEADYNFETIIADLLYRLTVLTIFISCIGLLALASFTAERRSKEIGIRKVLGATNSSVLQLISMEFIKYILYANVIAIPLGVLGMNLYLESFAYSIDIGVALVSFTVGFSILMAMATVGYQAFKASVANPIQTLKSE